MLEPETFKICRSCMKLADKNIFTTTFENNVTVAYILEKCIHTKVSSEDHLPKNICQSCFDELTSYYLFVINYERVQALLKDGLQSKLMKEEHLSDTQVDLGVKQESTNEDDNQPLSNLYDHNQRAELNCTHNISSKTESKEINEVSEKNSSISPNKIGTNIKNHELKNQKVSGSFVCKICHTLCSNKSTLSDHLNIIHKEKLNSSKEKKQLDSSTQKHVCISCNENFEFIKLLEKHCKNTGHAFPKRFSCDVCSKKFLSKTRLNEHLRIHNNDRPYKCNECGMTFTLSSNLKRHEKCHTGEKSYFCEICGRGFIQKHTLTIHMRLHNGETPYVCEICGKGYRAKPLLHQHMYKHNDTKVQTIKYQKCYLKYGKVKVECKVCKKIITKSALYNHMKVQHGDGLKKFLCNQCGKTYSTKMSLDVHMNVHTKQISYNCNVCSKSFTHQNYLKTHQMLHSGERPHCCDLCGKTFVQRTHLDRHKRTHTGARPYTCSFCDKSFALNENLKVHIRIHTGETPHHCSVCGKGFFNSSSKKKHEINVHQLQQK